MKDDTYLTKYNISESTIALILKLISRGINLAINIFKNNSIYPTRMHDLRILYVYYCSIHREKVDASVDKELMKVRE